MGVFTFVLSKQSDAEWSGKQLNGNLESSADSTFDLQRKLVECALIADSGPVQSSFTFVTPSSAVFQVIVGGGVVGGGISFAAPAASGGTGDAPPAEEAKAEESEEDDLESDIMDLFGGDD